MATEKQLAANRRNALKSTGPATEHGKTASKFNALKHGLAAVNTVLPHEDTISYTELRASLIADYQPASSGECMLVETIANAWWRLLRARRVEVAVLTYGVRGLKIEHDKQSGPLPSDDVAIAVNFADDDEDHTRKLERYTTRIERTYFHAMESLRKLQAERKRDADRAEAAEHRIGFVQHKRIQAAKRAGFEVTEDAHGTTIHILTPTMERQPAAAPAATATAQTPGAPKPDECSDLTGPRIAEAGRKLTSTESESMRTR